jgi:hypothetical protein
VANWTVTIGVPVRIDHGRGQARRLSNLDQRGPQWSRRWPRWSVRRSEAGLAPKATAHCAAAATEKGISNAQLDALKTSMLAVAFLAVLSFWFTRQLPGRPKLAA